MNIPRNCGDVISLMCGQKYQKKTETKIYKLKKTYRKYCRKTLDFFRFCHNWHKKENLRMLIP